MKNKFLEELRKNTSLEIRIRVSIQAYLLHKNGISFFIPLNEDGSDVKEYREKYNKILKEAEEIIGLVLENVKEWEDHGMPK